MDGRIGKMRVFQGGRRIFVAEKPADRGDRLAMGESHGPIGKPLMHCSKSLRNKTESGIMTQVMAADIPDTCLDSNRTPVTLKRTCREVPIAPW